MVCVAPEFIAGFALAQDRADADAIFLPGYLKQHYSFFY
jgi:hypothetical protein